MRRIPTLIVVLLFVLGLLAAAATVAPWIVPRASLPTWLGGTADVSGAPPARLAIVRETKSAPSRLKSAPSRLKSAPSRLKSAPSRPGFAPSRPLLSHPPPL